jgi:hypothetical protein
VRTHIDSYRTKCVRTLCQNCVVARTSVKHRDFQGLRGTRQRRCSNGIDDRGGFRHAVCLRSQRWPTPQDDALMWDECCAIAGAKCRGEVRHGIRDGCTDRLKPGGDDVDCSDAHSQGDLDLALLQMRAETAAPSGHRLHGAPQSSRTTLNSELLILMGSSPLYSMKPSFLNLFRKKFTRERVVPTISASVSCEIFGTMRTGMACFP